MTGVPRVIQGALCKYQYVVTSFLGLCVVLYICVVTIRPSVIVTSWTKMGTRPRYGIHQSHSHKPFAVTKMATTEKLNVAPTLMTNIRHNVLLNVTDSAVNVTDVGNKQSHPTPEHEERITSSGSVTDIIHMVSITVCVRVRVRVRVRVCACVCLCVCKLVLHPRSIRAVRYRGAILNRALNAHDTDRTSDLRHDVAIAYEMARTMTKSSCPTPLSVAPCAGFTSTHAFYAVQINYRCLKGIVGKFSALSSATV